MQTPNLKSPASPQAQPPDLGGKPNKDLNANAQSDGPASRAEHSDGGKQTRAIFGEAAAQQTEHSRLKAELTETGSKHISATSLMSSTPEELEISLPAERVSGGWKAKVASRDNGQGTQNLAAVRSDETGKWTLMPDKMEAAGQPFSKPTTFTKTAYNPVKGPFTASQGAEIAAKMLANIAHLEGKDLLSADETSGARGSVVSAENIMKAFNTAKGLPGQVYVYELGGEPAALLKGKMRDDLDRSFHINLVVSDPYARGAGTAMIEKAVNVSLENGGNGLVTLEANSSAAREQYEKLGFERYTPFKPSVWETDMKLDPSQSDQWEKVGDQYLYTGAQDQNYVTSLGVG